MAGQEVLVNPARLGQRATTLRMQSAEYIPVISDVTYKERTRKAPWVSYKGARPLHRTTLTLDRSKPKLDYVTLYKCYFRGNPRLQGVRRPPTCPSMFTSQWDIGENNSRSFSTINGEMFPPKAGESVRQMRSVQVVNRFNNTHGQKMMEVTDTDSGPSYFTTYRTVHDQFAKLRGPGVPHTRKPPPRFNVVTGMLNVNS